MVYLQGMSHQSQINVISAFYNKFWNQFDNFFKRSWLFAFDIWKKRRWYVCNISFFYWLIFIAFSMIMIHGYCSWNIFDDLFKCLRFLKGCLNAILQFPSHLQENLEIKKHTHTPDCFSLKNHGQSFFLNHLFLQI